MRLISIKKVWQSYLKMYKAAYENSEGNIQNYDFVSRSDNLDGSSVGKKTHAVMVVPFVGDKILLSQEFRLAVNDWVYNFPAGLIDAGETIEEAAIRELKEETGLNVTCIMRVLNPAFSSVGLSDEKVAIVFVNAEGEILGSDNPNEEINSRLYTLDELRELVDKASNMCSRTQLVSLLLCTNAKL